MACNTLRYFTTGYDRRLAGPCNTDATRFCYDLRMPGTAALKIGADDETGELESATILGQFGEVPDAFAESLQGD